MAADDLIAVGTYLTDIEAELAKSALEAAAIDAMIRADAAAHVDGGHPVDRP